MTLKAIDLCCGAGGWAFAARGLPIEFVAVADRAADCLEAWRINHAEAHPDCERLEIDLSQPESIERMAGPVDVILGGIPCAEISQLRQKVPSEETMDSFYALLDNVLGIVRRLCPDWWAIEDVVTIRRHLPLAWEFGHIPVRTIDASQYGPQARRRAFIGVFPQLAPRLLAEGTLGECLRPGPHLTIPQYEDYERLYYPGQQITLRSGDGTCRVARPDYPSPTVVSHGPTRGQRQRRMNLVEDEQGRLRIINWQEFARLQGFPDDALFPCGVTRAHEMIGQAIPIYVGRAILAAICAAAAEREEERGTLIGANRH